MTTSLPEISVIVPLLNEAAELPGLLASLAAQEGVTLETILCDGGSADGSQQLCRELGANTTLTVHAIDTPRGRGLQMNAGAAIARGDLLLFLHADSRFDRTDALRTAVSAYREASQKARVPLAARFRLSFRRRDTRPALAYYFYESKARLERADCIRGDQGFLLSRTLFDSLGGFDTALPFLEDIRLVVATAERAEWLLLPAEISTSARRFETEGLYERQVVNAIITDAIATGWTEFFCALPGIYRCNSVSGRLQLFPLLDGIRALLAAKPAAWLRPFWRGTGRHVAGNIWQLFFWLDVHSAFSSDSSPDDVPTPWLHWFQRHLERFTHGWLVETITAAAVWIWFRVLLIRHGRSIKTS
jgi:rSAM/selenodomain-associated transferase 2